MSSDAAIFSPRSERWPITLVVAVALAATFRAAGNDWSGYDDDLFLFRNPHYDPPTLASLGYYWSHGFRGLWTPVTHSAWWIIAKFSQIDMAEAGAVRLNPTLFHVFNIALHCVSAALVFVLIRRIVAGRWIAIFCACVFAAHGVQVEAVAWACGTKDLLACLFMLAAIACATTRGATLWHLLAAFACAALAMLSKPSAVVLPFMLVAYVATIPSQWAGASVRASDDSGVDVPALAALHRRTFILAVGILLLAVPVTIIARNIQVVGDVPHVSLLARPLVALDAITMHLAHLVNPMRLCADYGLTPSELLSSPRRWWTWAVQLALTAAVLRTRDRILIGGTALFVIAVLPNLGLAPFQFQVYSTVADRYAYPAMFGIAIASAGALSLARERLNPGLSIRRIALVVGGLWVLSACINSYRQCAVWTDARSLWSRTLMINPTSSLAHNNLGASLMAAGDLRGALSHFEAASQAGGGADAFALLNLAQLHVRLGDPNAAVDDVARLVEVYRTRGDYDSALERQTIGHFVEMIEKLDPSAAQSLRQRTAAAPRRSAAPILPAVTP